MEPSIIIQLRLQLEALKKFERLNAPSIAYQRFVDKCLKPKTGGVARISPFRCSDLVKVFPIHDTSADPKKQPFNPNGLAVFLFFL